MKGKTIDIDATTLEANAALRSIVLKDTGDSYQEFLVEPAKVSGIETPTREDLYRLDRKRSKKRSNDGWAHPHDPDSRITKMKEGRIHLVHTFEHAVDLETGVIVGATIQPANSGDTATMVDTLVMAAAQAETVLRESEGIHEVLVDKGYQSAERIIDLS